MPDLGIKDIVKPLVGGSDANSSDPKSSDPKDSDSKGSSPENSVPDGSAPDGAAPDSSVPKRQQDKTVEFFKDKTVFLTGGTGNLGACLLYKLTAVFDVRRIYVLCRGPAALAKIMITRHMPMQANNVLSHKDISFVEGDITEPSFAISEGNLEKLQKEVQIIINCAAKISLAVPLKETIEHNCLPPLELAGMATKFSRLSHFIQISTAYCNSFLPDGQVEEKIYDLGDPESELKTAQETERSDYVSQFPAPYYYAKHLMERLLTTRYPDLPILLLRPTTIGDIKTAPTLHVHLLIRALSAEAIQDPYRLYGVEGSCPLTTFYHIYMDDPGNATWYIAPETGRMSGSNIIDVIPVDWVAKLILLHATTNTKGVVHAGGESYRLGTFDSWEMGIRAAVPKEIRDWIAPMKYTHDKDVEECPAAQFFKVGTRDWRFSNKASTQFASVQGPLTLSVDDHEPSDQILEMVQRIALTVIEAKTKQKARAVYGMPNMILGQK